ncbi:hypothetical protein C1646_766743 [Rhizophagus diaphanus]|nr:hypothetical protein C1646_766743 [Rhizophagus diaphanus] [Rhizophagus sp. MUCL 43196]
MSTEKMSTEKMSAEKMSTDKIAPYSTYKMTTYKMSEELEERIKKLRKEWKASVNRVELAKWIEAGQPYEEHEELLLVLNQNEHTTCSESVAGRDNVDIGGEHIAGGSFTEVPGRQIVRPGRNAILELPPREPLPPDVRTANIVIKRLD